MNFVLRQGNFFVVVHIFLEVIVISLIINALLILIIGIILVGLKEDLSLQIIAQLVFLMKIIMKI